ncbi:MAG: polymer-forming cytoskeletal protein [Ignavibacteriaceae bacterium]|nr:polymer-forming cytoskeletal protein [Ignavibacteriaceae bacterium]
MKSKTNGNTTMEEVTIISSSVIIEGKLTSNGNVRIDGIVKGNVEAKGNLNVGESGNIQGDLHADSVTIGGKVEGVVNAKDKVTLENKSFLKGDLITKILVVEAGAIFEGRSSMGESKRPDKPASLNPS